MVLELHVWGPAFSLPSIDAQCLATITYISQAVPKDQWRLVASNDPSLSPTKDLPALFNENVWIGGFRNIIDYVSKVSNGEWCLDSDLEGSKKADVIAFSSFVESNGQVLLDLSLFVSSRNYTAITRPQYSSMLALPMPYIIPPTLRSAAKARTAHLGLSALDVDSAQDEDGKNDNQNPIPPHLRMPSKSLSSLLSSSPEANVLIRLDALADAFFEPLQYIRGNKRFFVAETPTSLDCLAFAYLALALLPDLPSSWLANCMRTKYPQLSASVHDLQRIFFGGAVQKEDALLVDVSERERRAAAHSSLPWMKPSHPSIGALVATFASSIGDSLPLISSLRETAVLKRELQAEVEDDEHNLAVQSYVSARRRETWTTAAAVTMGLGLFMGFVSYHGVLQGTPLGIGIFGSNAVARGNDTTKEKKKSGLDQFGEAGEALSALFGP